MPNQPYLSINLNAGPAGRKPSSAQLAALIREQISAPHLSPGCRMAPVRVLAHQLGVSKNTVQRAYDELVAQGLLVNRRRVGLFLAPREREVPLRANGRAAHPLFLEETLLPSPAPLQRTGPDLPIALSGATIDPDLLPAEKFAACLRSVLRDRRGRLATYPDVQGFPPLRQKIAERLNRRGIPARAEHVVTALGSQQCLDLVCRVLVRRTIATESPAYQIGKSLFELNGVKLAGLPLDPFRGVDLEDWGRRIARIRPGLLYLNPSFQNPTGYSYSSAELDRIVEWSSRYNFGILEDDWGSDMLSFSEFRPSLRALGGDEVLYVNAFTKKLLPSMRLGYIVGNDKTTPALVHSKHVSVLATPFVIEAALFEFLDRGYYDAHLRQLHPELDRRYRLCLDALRQTMPEEVRWTTPGGGPVLWVELPRRVDLESLTRRLAARKVYIRVADPAFIGAPHLHGFRLCHSSIKHEDMLKGLEILAEELRRSG